MTNELVFTDFGVKSNSKKANLINYLLFTYILFCSFFGALLSLSLPNFITDTLIVINIFYSIVIIVKSYFLYGNFFNPTAILLFVWGLLIPLTSFESVFMERMSTNSLQITLLAEIFMMVGLMLSNKGTVKSEKNRKCILKMNVTMFRVMLIIILLSITTIVLTMVKIRTIPLFSDNSSSFKTAELFPGSNIFINIGTIGVFYIFCDKEKRKKPISIIVIGFYFLVLILSAIRFTLFFVALMCISNIILDKRNFKYFLIVGVSLLVLFYVASFARRGNDLVEDYFINSGLYDGSVTLFQSTEIIRYFGMSQRVTEQYMNTYLPGANRFGYTLYPILKIFFIDKQLLPNVWYNGYNAMNIIGYLYGDFGFFWVIAIMIWAFVNNTIYLKYSFKKTLINRYLWSIAFVGLILSFYCYIHDYTYWVTIYLLVVLILNIRSEKYKKESNYGK